MKNGLELTGGWKRLNWIMDPARYQTALEQNMRRATQQNAQFVVREMRLRIKQEKYQADAALTATLKGSSKPLVDHAAGLFQAIEHTMIQPQLALAGVLRAASYGPRGGDEMCNLAVILHEGASIPVTPAMRGMFGVLARYSRGEIGREKLTGRAAILAERIKPGEVTIHPLKASTTEIVVPPRPFIREVAEDDRVRGECIARWEAAADAALHGGGAR